MHRLVFGLIGLPMLAQAQARTSADGPTRAVIRVAAGGAPGSAPVTASVQLTGQLFAALGVAPGTDGRRIGHVRLSDGGGTATTPAALEVSTAAGAVTFRAPAGGPDVELIVPGTALRARGRTVQLVRDRVGGPLRAVAVPTER